MYKSASQKKEMCYELDAFSLYLIYISDVCFFFQDGFKGTRQASLKILKKYVFFYA